MTSEYYSILTELSQRLSKDDLDNLVFSCGSILPLSTAEKLTTGIRLFRELKQRGHLGPTNYDYLRKQLVLVGRHDLASMLPDQFEILFGQSTVRDKEYFGCIVSPAAPNTVSNVVNVSSLKYCHTNTESRIYLLHLSKQLNSEDANALAFLMFPTHSQITALEFVELLEREGGLHSINVINRLSTCLEAVGRADLAQQLNFLKVPQILMSSKSLSTSQLQLDLKTSLLVHSKQQSFDFYMTALSEVECDSDVRVKLLSPIYVRIKNSFSTLSIIPLAHNLQEAFKRYTTINNEIELDSLMNNSILEALKVDQAYAMRKILVSHNEVPIEKLCKLTEEVHASYNSFSCLMDIINWNSVVRDELKTCVDQHRSPFGTPAEFACKYILELSQEISRGRKIYLEKQTTDCHIRALNSNYYCCCYHVIVLQWLASLLCFFTFFGFAQVDLCKFKATLQNVLQQKSNELMQSYSHLSDIFGPAVLQKLIPSLKVTESECYNSQSPLNPHVLLFNVLIIKLLAVATLGPDQTLSQYYLADSDHDQVLKSSSHVIMVSAAAMKKQVEAFRDKVLSEDPLCSHVIAALTA